MKTILYLIIGSIGFWCCNSITEKSKVVKNTISLNEGIIDFKTQVQPILEKNCSPCHFPGGKLYEKLPFDKGITIIEHVTGILKRIKNKEEENMIKQYTTQNKIADR